MFLLEIKFVYPKVYLYYHVKSLINSLLVIKYEMDSCQDDSV